MKHALRVTALALATLGTSIASASVWRPPNITCNFGKEADTGLVILSGTLPDVVVGHGVPISVFFEYKGVGKSFLRESNILLNRNAGLFKKAASDFEGLYSRLFVLQLKAGDYEFSGWYYEDPGKTEQRALGLDPLPFRVEAGRATYLGSFADNYRPLGKNFVGQPVGEAWYTVVDNQDRDLQVFAQKCPAFDAALIDLRVMDTGPWAKR